MLTKYIVGFNWVDFFIIGLVLRMCYIGLKNGIATESFKIAGLWFATVVALHIYTTPLGDLLNIKLPALPLLAGDVFCFVATVAIITIIARIIRESFFLLIKIEAKNTLDRWGGLLMGCLRGFWIASLGLFIMTISTVQYLETSAKTSLLGCKIIYFAPQIYQGSYNGLISKLVRDTKLNDEVFRAVER